MWPSQPKPPAFTTEKLSAESKSISLAKPNRAQEKGLWAEHYVLRFFQKKEWQLLEQRIKIEKVEVDLIFQKENRLVMIEVKYLDDPWRSFERVSPAQAVRLKRVLTFLRMKYLNLKVEGYLAFVHPKSGVKFISLDEME